MKSSMGSAAASAAGSGASPEPPLKRLGKRRSRDDHRTLKLSKYLSHALPAPPAPHALPAPPPCTDYMSRIASWPMYLNDQLGNCVIAAMGHLETQASAYAGNPRVPTNQDILAAYEAIGGYKPGDPSTDQGADMLTALNYWRQTGLGGRKIYAYAQVDPNNFVEVRQALTLFGGLFVGLQLPVSVQQSAVWDVPPGGPVGDGAPGSWGGHSVSAGFQRVSYPARTKIVSWGQPLPMTWPFVWYYCDELYCVILEDWLEANGHSPSGFDLAALQSDLALITG